VLRLLLGHLLLDIELVTDVFNRPHPLLLLEQQPIYQRCHPQLKSRAELALQPVDHLLEVVRGPQGAHFDPCQVLTLAGLLVTHHGYLLVDLEELAL
jgi:hypothetical protein